MKRLFLLCALGAFFLAGGASAETITVHSVVDLGDFGGTVPGIYGEGADILPSILIHAGDTVILDYDFLPGQVVKITGGSVHSDLDRQTFGIFFWQDPALAGSNNSFFTTADGSISLKGLSGDIAYPISQGPGNGGSAGVGADISGNFVGAGSSVLFTGMQSTFTLATLENGQSYYYRPAVYVLSWDGGNVEVVPEPNAISMLIAGLCFVAWAMRRRTLRRAKPSGNSSHQFA